MYPIQINISPTKNIEAAQLKAVCKIKPLNGFETSTMKIVSLQSQKKIK